jgi:hypothetical protein
MEISGLLLCSDIHEPVSKVLIQHKDELAFPFLIMTLEDFLKDVEVFDEIIDGIPKIEWTCPKNRKITNSDWFLVNRVLSLPQKLFEDFHPEDREYAQAEFRAYLMFALMSFPESLGKPGQGGLSGNRYSLPLQWSKVENLNLEIAVPIFFLGNKQYMPFDNASKVVHTSPFNYYFWKPDVKKESEFCFIRPEGNPVISSVVGDQGFAFPAKEDYILDTQEERITVASKKIADEFGYPIAESLWFVDGEHITFGMMSNIPYASKNKRFFQSSIIQALNAFYQGRFCDP